MVKRTTPSLGRERPGQIVCEFERTTVLCPSPSENRPSHASGTLFERLGGDAHIKRPRREHLTARTWLKILKSMADAAL